MSIKDLFIGADLTSVKSQHGTARKTKLISAEDSSQKKPNEKQQRQDDDRGGK